MMHVFLTILPMASTALLQSSRSLRDHRVSVESSHGAKENRWWPFNILGGSRPKSGGNAKRVLNQKLANFGDTQYFSEIEVGGQKVKAVIDTGSFELLVFGANCTACGSASHLYDSSKSKSSTVVDFEATHAFGSGTTRSREAIDKLKIGHFSIPNQSFWEVYDADTFVLQDGKFQAILGVGPPASAVAFAQSHDDEIHKDMKSLKKRGRKVTKEVKDTVQFYDDMVAYMKNVTSVPENLNLTSMSICLGQKSGSAGYLLWDDDATDASPEKFATTRVYGDYYWSASLGRVHLAGTSVQEEKASKQLKQLASETIELGCPTNNCSAILDTGSSLLAAPLDVVDAIYDLADEWQSAGGSCEDLSELPELRFSLNGIEFSLPPEAYMGEVNGAIHDELAKYMPRLLKKRNTVLAKRDKQQGKSKSGHCEPLIMSMDAESQFGQLWILGMPFFRKYYTSFGFIQRDGQFPEAATMSFSEQDGKCKPGVAPKPRKKGSKTAHQVRNSSAAASDSVGDPTTPTPSLKIKAKRRAQLKVDASHILLPSLVAHRRAR